MLIAPRAALPTPQEPLPEIDPPHPVGVASLEAAWAAAAARPIAAAASPGATPPGSPPAATPPWSTPAATSLAAPAAAPSMSLEEAAAATAAGVDVGKQAPGGGVAAAAPAPAGPSPGPPLPAGKHWGAGQGGRAQWEGGHVHTHGCVQAQVQKPACQVPGRVCRKALAVEPG